MTHRKILALGLLGAVIATMPPAAHAPKVTPSPREKRGSTFTAERKAAAQAKRERKAAKRRGR